MMLYPEGVDDPRATSNQVNWGFTREQVANMTPFEAKSAGALAEDNAKILRIDWVSFESERFSYRSVTPGKYY